MSLSLQAELVAGTLTFEAGGGAAVVFGAEVVEAFPFEAAEGLETGAVADLAFEAEAFVTDAEPVTVWVEATMETGAEVVTFKADVAILAYETEFVSKNSLGGIE